MGRPISRYYFLCQAGGWSFVLLILIFARLAIAESIIDPLLVVTSGIFATHLLRNSIIKYGWLKLSLKKMVAILSVSVFFTGTLAETIGTIFRIMYVTIISRHQFHFRFPLFLGNCLTYFILFIPWALIYCFYYYTLKRHKDDLEKIRLESLLKERKTHSEESSVDIDFILNSLNRIQNLIDENPTKSRSEITDFSNLLRKGYLY